MKFSSYIQSVLLLKIYSKFSFKWIATRDWINSYWSRETWWMKGLLQSLETFSLSGALPPVLLSWSPWGQPRAWRWVASNAGKCHVKTVWSWILQIRENFPQKWSVISKHFWYSSSILAATQKQTNEKQKLWQIARLWGTETCPNIVTTWSSLHLVVN